MFAADFFGCLRAGAVPALACAFVAAPSAGQSSLYGDLHRMIPVEFVSSEVLADLDGDGNLDLVSIRLQLALGGGRGRFTLASGHLPAVPLSFVNAVVAADVDGDGDLDLFLCRGEPDGGSQNLLLRNDGSGRFTDATFQLPARYDASLDVAFGDVDGDGDLDAYVANGVFDDPWGEQNTLLLNDGAGVFTDASDRLPSVAETTSLVRLGDVDGDGDLDVVLDTSRMELNDGSGYFTDAGAQAPTTGYGFDLGDVDGNRTLDLVAPRAGHNVLLLNPGNGWFADASQQIHGTATASRWVQLRDLDGDGDLDFLSSDNDGTVVAPRYAMRWFENDGSGVFADSTAARFPEGAPADHFLFGDLDGDGDLDAVSGRRVLLANGRGVLIPAREQAPLDLLGATAAALADFDADGDLDVLLGDLLGDKLWLNDGTGFFADASQNLPGTPGRTRSIALGDVDGDRDVDVLLGNGGFGPVQNRLYLNDGSGYFADGSSQLPGFVEDTLDVALGDVDGDGDLDAVLANQYGPTRLYLNASGFFADATGQLPAGTHVAAAVVLGDLDGDRDLDLVVGNQGELDGLFLNDGSGQFTDATGLLPSFAGDRTEDLVLVDVDADGDLDLFEVSAVPFGPGATQRLFLNDGRGAFSEASQRLPPSSSGASAAIALQANGDRAPDLLLFRSPASLYLNDGAGSFLDATARVPAQAFNLASITYASTEQLAVGDIDGDGEVDAVLPSLYTAVWSNLARQLAWREVPRVGQPLIFDVFGPPGGSYVALGSLRRGYRPFDFGNLWLSPAHVFRIVPGRLDADGHGVFRHQVPSDPALIGRTWYWQALVRFPRRLTNLETTPLTGL